MSSVGPEPPQPRVLLVCEWFVKYTAGLAAGLAENGCEVALLTRDHDLEFGGEPGALRRFVAEVAGARVEHLELGGRVRELGRLPEVLALRRRLRGLRPDVIHLQDSLTHDMRLAVAAGLPGPPYALTVHDPTPHPGDETPSARVQAVRRALRRRAGLLFVHSEGMAAELREMGDARAAVEVVPHGFAEPAAEPLPERPSILFFGRISHYKGLDTLLDAMQLLWAQHPEVTVTVAGEGDLPEHPALSDERLTLRHEHVPEEAMPELFGAATVVALPYRQASQSGVGSEAKRYGRPLVVTDVGGLPELVDERSGRLVPPEDPAALAAALLEIVADPALAVRLGEGAAASVAEAGWGAVGEKTIAAYRRDLL